MPLIKLFLLSFTLIQLFSIHAIAEENSTAVNTSKNAINAPNENTKKYTHEQALSISQGALGNVIGHYQLKSTTGASVDLQSFSGKPIVISLVYTSCYHICPMITQHLNKVVKKARDVLGADSFNVLTIGFDTQQDTPQAMEDFAKTQSAGASNWYFLSSDAATMTALTRDLGFLYSASPHGFDHLIQASIIDKNGALYRQVYGMKPKTQHFVEPLKELIFGQPENKNIFDELTNKIKLFCTVYDPASDSYTFDYSIFVGLFMGLSIGSLFIYLLFREWRHTEKEQADK